MGVSESSRGTGLFDLEAADLARLREVLAGHGLLGEAARQAVGERLGPAHLRKDLPLYLRRLSAATPLNTALKLLSLGQWLDEAEAATAVAPVPVADLVKAGLLERGPDGVRGRVELVVHRDLLLAHDRYEEGKGDLAPDHVLGTNAPAGLLDCLTVRHRVTEALDLGCGGGVQSLLAARHSDRVFAVDRNPRALEFLRLNARLNGVSNVEPLEGDLFAPVKGRRFGLLVCNPPYVISPDARYVFMDSGRPLDSICEEVVRRGGDHLEEGGFATILCNWALRKGDEWDTPLRRWVEGTGCDALLIRGDVQDPLSYAAVWNRGRAAQEYGEALDRWLRHYREAGIEGIAMGAVVLRRRASGSPFVRAYVVSRDPDVPCHEHLLRIFAAEDYLAGVRDDALLLQRAFHLVEGHHVRQSLRRQDDRWGIERSEIVLEGGLAFEGAIDPAGLHLLQRCDGRTAVGTVVEDIARAAGTAPDRLAQSVAATVRKLLSLGFLVPAGEGQSGADRAREH